MPELPEVQTVRTDFHNTVLGLDIIETTVFDDSILRNRSANQFRKTLIRQKFVDTYRQGKYFFGILNNDLYILFHLGMTGDITYYFDNEDQSKYERFNIHFSNGMQLGYHDQRKFSNILIIDDIEAYLKRIKLGPDALLITGKEFHLVFENRSTSVKSVLMNQQLLAGIGNLYADEICYQSRIHPASIAGALNKQQLNTLYNSMKDILQEACKRNARYQIYPDDWFWKWRNQDVGMLDGKGPIRKMKIAGRTTYYVEGYQKLLPG